MILVLILRSALLVHDALCKHIVILCLLVVRIQAQRLPKSVECRLVLLLHKEALTEVTQHLCALSLCKERIGGYLLVEGVRCLVCQLLILWCISLEVVVGIGTIIQRLIYRRIHEICLVILLKTIVIVACVKLLVTLAHKSTLGVVLRNHTLGQRNTKKHKA